MIHPKIQLRSFSSSSLRPRSASSRPRVIGVYGYIVAGFTLPFAVPAARRRSSIQGDISGMDRKEELSLYHCCR
ncbi:uncharacterized protein LAJ45_01649 [Morchella importuna]|uniref:uncharacterized protein n=1 Tax=Morchella importuna TaxID=1174673 RepID=UPI001E8D212D|nr:uncharacterized protein LAJ45_01649 [Morchella importuna]KAH8153882.1 hypothetical protein LAJ45_01649 [Morchella importuna]